MINLEDPSFTHHRQIIERLETRLTFVERENNQLRAKLTEYNHALRAQLAALQQEHHRQLGILQRMQEQVAKHLGGVPHGPLPNV